MATSISVIISLSLLFSVVRPSRSYYTTTSSYYYGATSYDETFPVLQYNGNFYATLAGYDPYDFSINCQTTYEAIPDGWRIAHASPDVYHVSSQYPWGTNQLVFWNSAGTFDDCMYTLNWVGGNCYGWRGFSYLTPNLYVPDYCAVTILITKSATISPTNHPTDYPTSQPTIDPTAHPTSASPTTASPTKASPTLNPTLPPLPPYSTPNQALTISPTSQPTYHPTAEPTIPPTYLANNPKTISTVHPTQDLSADGIIDTTRSTPEPIQATKIILKSQESGSVINLESLNTTQLIIGLLIILACCIGPILIAFCICFCMYKKRQTATYSEDKKQQNSEQEQQGLKFESNKKDHKDDEEISKVGMSATDSLKLKPGESDNYSLTPSGPKMIVIDANSRPTPQNEKITGANPLKPPLPLGKMRSDDSSAIYENVEHEYEMNTRDNEQMQITDHEKLELTKLSTGEDNEMREMLECVINQPSINNTKEELELQSDNSDTLYRDRNGHTTGYGTRRYCE